MKKNRAKIKMKAVSTGISLLKTRRKTLRAVR